MLLETRFLKRVCQSFVNSSTYAEFYGSKERSPPSFASLFTMMKKINFAKLMEDHPLGECDSKCSKIVCT